MPAKSKHQEQLKDAREAKGSSLAPCSAPRSNISANPLIATVSFTPRSTDSTVSPSSQPSISQEETQEVSIYQEMTH